MPIVTLRAGSLWLLACGAIMASSLAPSAAGEVRDQDSISLRALGSFFVGGKTVSLSGLPDRMISFTPGGPMEPETQNGRFETGQMYVQYRVLAHPRHRPTLLLWHGGGFTGSVWETTPDGRPGWETWFLAHGWNVDVSDSVERGRSGFSQVPQIYHSQAIFRSEQEAWEAFRLGVWGGDPTHSRPFPGQTFPIAAFRAMMQEAVPRWTDNDDIIQAAYDQFVESACPCVVVAHSHDSIFAVRAAARHPDLVRALVLLEPSSAPALSVDEIENARKVPQLFVWGDFIALSPTWIELQKKPRAYYESIRDSGHATWLDLPSAGLHGDSHLLMMNQDSDRVAELTNAWLEAQVGSIDQDAARSQN